MTAHAAAALQVPTLLRAAGRYGRCNAARAMRADANQEPIAIVGMAALYPGGEGLDAFWTSLAGGRRHFDDVTPGPWTHGALPAGDPPAGDRASGRAGALVPPLPVDLASYGIVPAHAGAIARAHVLLLEMATRCLADAGYRDREFARDRTDVICGCCFGFERTHANALRVESAQVAARVASALLGRAPALAGGDAGVRAALKQRFLARFGASAHDRLGEMASTIPARISIAHRLRGRCLTVESADATSFAALRLAVTNLRRDEADLALVAVGQLREGPVTQSALARKGLLAPGSVLGEGFGALLLKRLDDAVRDGDRVYALVKGVGLRHVSRPGSFRYPADVGAAAATIADACAEARCDPASLQYVECFGAGLPGEDAFERQVLAAARGAGAARPLEVGSVKESIGHTFANAGLASITKVALALQRRTLLPGRSIVGGAGSAAAPSPGPRPWPTNAEGLPRRAGVAGYSLTGTCCHVVLEEFVPARVAPAASSRRSAGRRRGDTAVAVVGFGGRFADAPSAARFWENICRGHDALRPLPASVIDPAVYHDPDILDPFTTYTLVASKVQAPGIPERPPLAPARVQHMDLAQRLALAVASDALDAWTSRQRAPRGRAAVVFGSPLCLNAERDAAIRLLWPELESVLAGFPPFAALDDAARLEILEDLRRTLRDRIPPLSAWSLDGYLASGLPAIVSNELGLDAVPIAVEAACASSLAALDVAIRGLTDGQYDLAIAGGVDLPSTARDLVVCANLRLLSPTRIKPFDATADGFSPGDGAAAFVLRRLEDALADGDRVHAVLRGVGAACDARSLVAPDPHGQELAMRRAFERVEFDASTVQYVEAHGTGTTLGDQVEASALAAVYGGGRSTPLAIGSVKSMIGHTFAAAGAAGLLKTVLALQHRLIPPNARLERPNTRLGLESIPAYVSTDLRAWPAPDRGQRRAAVSAMGTGGINYHVLLEEAP